MSNTAIKVDGLGKKYILRHQQGGQRYKALRDVLTERVKRMFKPSARSAINNSQSEEYWAVKDLSFEVKQGEAIGIIGRNGAGKSTLLKLLSRITEPSTGRIEIEGRVASLLEVGTGFHPELTGRENIYLNGAILGMLRTEIKSKFDEIVAFAEVEKFLDTPVKRYSSGMYMRLAFAVAAHLEPDTLIVDEVLAVGDAAFQKKCLGKMQDVSARQGRTVLFVSHNMQAINVLCHRAILLRAGSLEKDGGVAEVIRHYTSTEGNLPTLWTGSEGDENVKLLQTSVFPAGSDEYFTDNELEISMKYRVLHRISNLVAGFHLRSEFDTELAYCLYDDYEEEPAGTIEPGEYIKRFRIPANTLAKGMYHLKFDIGIHMLKKIISTEGSLSFNLINRSALGCRYPVEDSPRFSSLLRPHWARLDLSEYSAATTSA